MALSRSRRLNSADYSAQAWDYQDNLDQGRPDSDFVPADSFSATDPSGTSSSTAPGGASQGEFTAGAAGGNPLVVTSASSGLVFVNTFAAGVSAAYESCVIAAENALQALATNSDTVYVTFDTVNNGPHGDLATNGTPTGSSKLTVSFSQLKSALASHEHTAIGAAAVASLNGLSDPSDGAGFELPTPYAVMLGLAANPGSTEVIVNLNIGYSFVFGQDVTDELEHELSEGVLGRVSGLGDVPEGWHPMDLFRFNASGQRDYQDGRDGVTTYFSYDDGSTTSQSAGLSFNNRYAGSTEVNTNDIADFTEQDVFGTGSVGQTNSFSQTDLQILEALGWNPVVPQYPDSAGNVDEWILSNGQWAASAQPGSHPSGYQVAGVGDFTGNGTDDILWYNSSSGDVDEWEISYGAWAGSVDLGTHPGNYQIAGIGDFTGNGTDDVLWTSVSGNGQVQTDVWELSDGQWAASTSLGSHPAGYQVAGIGELANKGTSEIFWENPTTGDVDEWQISQAAWADSVDLGTHPGNYQIAAIGHFFGSGLANTDILWTSVASNGQIETDIWELGSNGQWMASVQPGSHPAGYNVVGVGDFTGNGTDDILWQNPTTGDVDEWQISKGQWVGSVDLGTHPGSYQIAGIGNFAGPGASDILFHSGS